ncbi:ribonuclease H-like domain-containing protein [Tanacetum coccineum]|uniref:Ribonuclease H-like domain-containing protein n=1 Tax=Tanacetum coccineum TaxID=301880 RepID=A0ABQ5J7Q3_9ASTR
MVPRAVLMKSGLVSVNTARQVNTTHSKTTVNAARPMSYLSKTAHSTVMRPIHKNTTFNNNNIDQRVNTVRGKNVNTARPEAVVNVVKGNNFNVVKTSAYLQELGVIDSGCSRLMTGNMSYLTDYEEIDGGYVVFGENPKGGKITRKGKFDGKADKGFFVGYSLNSKAFRVFNSRTRIVEENLHIRFSENTPNVVGTKASDNVGQARKETKPVKNYILLPLWTPDLPYSQNPKSSHDMDSKPSKKILLNILNNVNAAGINEVNAVCGKTSIKLPFDPNMPALEDYSIFDFSRDDEDDGAEADMNK